MKDSDKSSWSQLPFYKCESLPNFILCKPDIAKPDVLPPCKIDITPEQTFVDRVLPPTSFDFRENDNFPTSYFIDLHNIVKSYGTHNYLGARIPLRHNNIDVSKFRFYLNKFSYPDIQILQFVELGFPLGLWSNAYLEPSCKNHSSAYSYFSYVDKFVSTELQKLGMSLQIAILEV